MRTSKLPITSVHLMNNNVLPTFEAANAKFDVVLSDNWREFCGRPDQHPYELFLQLEEIEHRLAVLYTEVLVEQRAVEALDDAVGLRAFDLRHSWFETIEEMQVVLDEYLIGYNQRRPHQGHGMKGRKPARTFREHAYPLSSGKTCRGRGFLYDIAHAPWRL